MGKIKIQNELIEFKEKELKVDDLLFWEENPRVYSILRMHTGGEEPTQKEIEDIMIQKCANVKELRSSIKANGGLTHPIFVRKNVVIEGNSRLAAYRLLCRSDKLTWAKIRCNVLPDDISDDLVFALIGSIHINGVTEWTPFEQAGYLFRHLQKSKKPIEAICKECGLTPAKARLYVKVYETMMSNEDTEQSKWSYYFEMLKNKSIPEKNAKIPGLNLIDNLCQKIKNGNIDNASDLRKIAKLASADNKEANEALFAYLQGTESLDTAVAKVSEQDKIKHAINTAEKFREQLKDKEFIIKLMDDNDEFKFEMQKIITRLGKLFADEQAD